MYLISALNGLGADKSEIKALAREASIINPLYFHNYNAAVLALLPRWGADAGELEEFTEWVGQVEEGSIGLEFYFRAVRMAKWQIQDRKYPYFNFNWKKIEQGFDEYVKRYFVVDKDYHLMAKLAGLHGDRDAAKYYFLQTDGQWNHFAKKEWNETEVLNSFKTWANEKSDYKHTEMLMAMLEERFPLVTLLLKEYKKTGGEINKTDVYGNTVLHLAVENGHYELVEIILALGADVNLFNSDGLTPLHLAAQGGYAEVIRLLLSNDADISAKTIDLENTTVSLAATNGFASAVNQLLSKEPSLLKVANKYGRTPLHHAALEGRTDTVSQLLDYPISEFDAQDLFGDTALHLAASRGHTEVIQMLVDAGANLNITNQKNHTSLSLAKEKGFADLVAYLNSKNAEDSDNIVTEEAIKKADNLYTQGSQYFNTQNYQKAKVLYLESVKLNPNNFVAYSGLAMGAWQFEGDLNQAEVYIQKSIELNPNYVENYYWRGRINYDLGRAEVYKPLFQKYVKLAPETHNTKDLQQNYANLLIEGSAPSSTNTTATSSSSSSIEVTIKSLFVGNGSLKYLMLGCVCLILLGLLKVKRNRSRSI